MNGVGAGQAQPKRWLAPPHAKPAVSLWSAAATVSRRTEPLAFPGATVHGEGGESEMSTTTERWTRFPEYRGDPAALERSLDVKRMRF